MDFKDMQQEAEAYRARGDAGAFRRVQARSGATSWKVGGHASDETIQFLQSI
jgi:hypothetical protein